MHGQISAVRVLGRGLLNDDNNNNNTIISSIVLTSSPQNGKSPVQAPFGEQVIDSDL